MEAWLPEHGVEYMPALALGGRRQPRPDSPNVALREPGFRAYADYMQTTEFRRAFDWLLETAQTAPTAIMCSETLWWRCHRRLIADAAVLLRGVDVIHLVGAAQQPHRTTAGVRVANAETLVYDGDYLR